MTHRLCDMPHSYVRHDTYTCPCDMTHRLCDMTHSYVRHDTYSCPRCCCHRPSGMFPHVK